MKKTKILTTMEEIKAFSDPYRIQILFHYRKLARPATVKQIADEMGETPAKVHYHVKKLEKVGILRLIHTEEINGIVAKYYGLTAEDFLVKHEGIDSNIKENLKGETQKMIANMYESSMKTMIEQFTKASDEEDPVKVTGHLGIDELYLTEKEAQEFVDMIHKFCEAHNDKKQVGKDAYHLFTSFMPIIKKDKNNKV